MCQAQMDMINICFLKHERTLINVIINRKIRRHEKPEKRFVTY